MERIKVSAQEGYRRWAPAYDAHQNPLVMVEEPHVRRLLGDVRGKRVLDAGCGTGRHALRMHAEGARVTGIDPCDAMLDIARAKCAEIEWRSAELTSLGVPDAAFDIALCALVFEHVADPSVPLRNLHRALVPGGKLLVSVFHPWFLLKGVPPHFESAADGGEGVVDYELPSYLHLPSTYFSLLRAMGMEVLEMVEPLVDDALIERRPRMEKHRGLPLALIFEARKAS